MTFQNIYSKQLSRQKLGIWEIFLILRYTVHEVHKLKTVQILLVHLILNKL